MEFRYGDLKKKLDRNVSEAVDYLLTNFESEFCVGRQGPYGDGPDMRRTPLVTDDEEVSSFNSLYDQVSWPAWYAFFVAYIYIPFCFTLYF